MDAPYELRATVHVLEATGISTHTLISVTGSGHIKYKENLYHGLSLKILKIINSHLHLSAPQSGLTSPRGSTIKGSTIDRRPSTERDGGNVQNEIPPNPSVKTFFSRNPFNFFSSVSGLLIFFSWRMASDFFSQFSLPQIINSHPLQSGQKH